MMGLTDVKQPLELCCCVFDKGIKKQPQPKKPIFLHIQGEKGECVARCFAEDKRKMVVGGKNRRDVGNERGCD